MCINITLPNSQNAIHIPAPKNKIENIKSRDVETRTHSEQSHTDNTGKPNTNSHQETSSEEDTKDLLTIGDTKTYTEEGTE